MKLSLVAWELLALTVYTTILGTICMGWEHGQRLSNPELSPRQLSLSVPVNTWPKQTKASLLPQITFQE